MSKPTAEQIQKAKDLIWQYIDEHNKELMILKANTDSLKDNNLEMDTITLCYQYKNPCSLCNNS